MKIKLSLILGGLFLLAQTGGVVGAQTIVVSATVPSATGISLTVTPVNATTNVWNTGATIVNPAAISFGILTYNATSLIYLPTNYYAIDIGTTGGAGSPTVAVTYVEGTGTANPNGVATNGLGTKSTATFVTTSGSGTNTTDAQTSLGKKRLIDLTGAAGELTSIPSGSWERVYLGIWTGSTTTPADPTNGKPFSNTDVAGTYSGSLTFTVVTL